ncbi:MAG: hypothetical protein ABIK99_05200 [candidate division WOR-3 bacterium]
MRILKAKSVKRGNGKLSLSYKLLAAPSQGREKNTPLVPKGYF